MRVEKYSHRDTTGFSVDMDLFPKWASAGRYAYMHHEGKRRTVKCVDIDAPIHNHRESEERRTIQFGGAWA